MEIWKDVIGYEGLYRVSNYGKVNSLNYGNHARTNIPCVNAASVKGKRPTVLNGLLPVKIHRKRLRYKNFTSR